MEWNDYLSHILSSNQGFDNLRISLDGGKTESEIPPIIKASVLMLDRMLEKQGKYNIFVFPEKSQSFLIFTLIKLLHNISLGKIQSNYDPTVFKPGEKLKVGNAIVEYLGYEERSGKTCINIRVADTDKVSTPISYLPVFQRVSTKRKLSKKARYVSERNRVLGDSTIDDSDRKMIMHVANMKTHMDSSIFSMTSVTNIKEEIAKCTIDGKNVSGIFYIGHSDYEGRITNVGAGQMAGIPAIVFASDLYAINAAAENGNPMQSIIIDISNSNVIAGQLDALDELLKMGIPIAGVTDTSNSFDLNPFVERGFNIWRWDNTTIPSDFYNVVPLSADRRIKNCVQQSVVYLKSEDVLISDVMRRLSAHRKETENQSPQMMKLFEKLSSLIFRVLRETIPLLDADIEYAQLILHDCDNVLSEEKRYLSETCTNDYSEIIAALKKIYIPNIRVPKNVSLQKYMTDNPEEKIVLIIPENSGKKQVQNYWQTWCLQRFRKNRIVVYFPSEYYAKDIDDTDATVICGWLKRSIMRKLIFSFNTPKYVVLLYNYENRWKNYDSSKWARAVDKNSNANIIEKSFNTDTLSVSPIFHDEKALPLASEGPDELGEIELILRENRVKQYAGNNSGKDTELISAVPVSFVGGYLAFYRTGHKVITATRIITLNSDRIETKLATELKSGDFIVIRESDRDIVRELADIALLNSGKEGLRAIASKWKEALSIELLFDTEEALCERIIAAGCNKEMATIKRWIDDEDVIAPQSKEDIRIIAEVTGNEVLLESLDKIYEAALEVRKAHGLAGRKLSEQLKVMLAKELKEYGEIDPFNFWEPIDIDIENIGSVKVLKIIDIGTEILVDPAITDHLIEE